jgi:hypothetical protein
MPSGVEAWRRKEMKKLIILLVLVTATLFAQGVDYYKNQQKKIAVQASLVIVEDTLTFKQIDQIREAWAVLSKYNLKAKLVLNDLEQFNYKNHEQTSGKSFSQRVKEFEERHTKAKAAADSVFNKDCNKQFKEINEKLGKIFFELKDGKIYKAVKNIEYYYQ